MLPVGDGIYEYSSINSVPALLGDFGGGTKIQQTKIEASLAGEVRRSVTTNINTSQTISVSTVIPAPGWYNLQARALYDTYMIIEVSEVYDVYANQKGVLVRNDDMPTRTFVLDRHVRFAYYGYNETGLYKYNYNGSNDTYVIDDSYMPNANDVVYL